MNQPSSLPDQWLSLREAADYTGFSTQTVRQWVRSGKLQFARPAGQHGHIRIKRSELDRFLGSPGVSIVATEDSWPQDFVPAIVTERLEAAVTKVLAQQSRLFEMIGVSPDTTVALSVSADELLGLKETQ